MQEKLLLKSNLNCILVRFSTPEHPFTEKEVVLSFGCSGALYNAIAVLCEVGDNIVVPKPGFPLC